MDDYKFQIGAATDDRPYFFHFFKWRVLGEVLELRKRGGASLVEWGYLVLTATLVQSLLLGVLLILLPLLLARRDWPVAEGGRMGAYFFLLGLAFLFVEMAFIQKFILFLSHPLYSVAVVLGGFPGVCRTGQPLIPADLAVAVEKRGSILRFGAAGWRLSSCWCCPTWSFCRGFLHSSWGSPTLLRIGDRPGDDCAAGVLHGTCLSRWASGTPPAKRTRFHTLGLGYQWLCFGDQRNTGHPAGDRTGLYNRTADGTGSICAGGSIVHSPGSGPASLQRPKMLSLAIAMQGN